VLCKYRATAPAHDDPTKRTTPQEYLSRKHERETLWTGLGVFGGGALLVAVLFWAVLNMPKPSKAPLSDDDRIERMEREKRDLIETDRWMKKKLQADEWDKFKGR
jgi:hypothetical protein